MLLASVCSVVGARDQGLNIKTRFSNLLINVHASVKDEQDECHIVSQNIENVVAAPEDQPHYAL
ncbi:MAG: hypothetical protein R6V38_03955 [Roseovarius gahaiensis]